MPPEQLDDNDEHQFQAEEEEAEERAERDDSCYHGSSGFTEAGVNEADQRVLRLRLRESG